MGDSLTVARGIVAIIRDVLLIALMVIALVFGVRVAHNLNRLVTTPAELDQQQPCLIDPQSRACLDR